MKAKIHVTLKKGVLDPQGTAIKQSLHNLNMADVENVTQGKYFEITLSEKNPEKAKEIITKSCEKLLANTVIENYNFELVG
jgi:phosphoribosylformylglycinamidine synthase PurS subunit